MTYTKKCTIKYYKYYLNGIDLAKVCRFKDFGIHFNSYLLFNEHYVYMLNKASFVLCFINRSCMQFNNPCALQYLYCSFVLSIIINYNSIIWSPYTSGLIQVIEVIQNRFLRMIYFM